MDNILTLVKRAKYSSNAALFLFLAIFMMGCSKSSSSQPPNSIGNQANINSAILSFDIQDAKSFQAETLIRPGVVAYGLLDLDRNNNYYGLKQFTSSTQGRGGYVKIDEISSLLRSLNTTADLTQKLQQVDAAVTLAIANGSKVQLNLACMLPNSLSKLKDFNHDVISGENKPSGQPIYACSPLKNDVLAFDTWFFIMEETAKFFSKYGEKVVFIIGNEPETYFAGNSTELLKLFEVTAKGLRSGNPNVKIGGLSPHDYKLKELTHTAPLYNATTDKFSYSIESLSKPLLQIWLEHLQGQNLPIDIIQTKKFKGNPNPSITAFWVETKADLEVWLQNNPLSHSNNVELIFSDFPGWHTVCSEDLMGNRESIWDSEYFSAWFTSTYIAMKIYSAQSSGVIKNIEPLLGYLIEYGSSAFFHTSCENDQSKPGGFTGAMGLVTDKTLLPKPILHSLNFLTSLKGSIIEIQNNDPNIHAIAAYDTLSAQTTILISYFIPSELNYNTAGYIGYDWGQLFFNKYGESFSIDDLKTLPPKPELSKYISDPNYPKLLIQDLLALPELINLNTLGLPQNITNFLISTRKAGIENRNLIKNSLSGKDKSVSIQISGMNSSGQLTLKRQVIDKNHGNAYTNRFEIQNHLEAAFANGGLTEVNSALESYRIQYGINSTHLSSENLKKSQSLEFEISLKPNSVHLLILK